MRLGKRLYPDDPEKQDEYEDIRAAGEGMGAPRDDSNSKFEDSQSPKQSAEQ